MTHPLVTEARKLLGKPFRHHGRGPRYFDCAGLCIAAYKAATGSDIIDVKYYGREPHRNGLQEAIERNAGKPVAGPPQPGDVLLIRFNRAPHHMGIVGETPYGALSLIHAHGESGRVVEHRLDEWWQQHIVAIYRPEVR